MYQLLVRIEQVLTKALQDNMEEIGELHPENPRLVQECIRFGQIQSALNTVHDCLAPYREGVLEKTDGDS